ncbi:Bug family tripartite tricarboxylate transporter substrate binding protein [Muricoccus radiodurans]|uniref:Bug family tripartite tricarboxylate transporter substrate binding protein n=1 Tax=Muricoccus radiodurans TaxID=2231721 RepID=UPI003CF2A1D1
MTLTRRHALAAGLAPALGLMVRPAAAQPAYPNRPIRMIVPYAAGGADSYIRPLQNRVAQELGQALVIESVTGGGGATGAQRVKSAAPDGYTVLFAGTGALTAVPRLQDLSYSIADFSPIGGLVAISYVLATGPRTPFRTLPEMLAAARARPEGLTYGTPGVGSTPHLAAEAMAKSAGIRLLHVPYNGVATAAVALLAGDVDLVMGAPSNIMPLVAQGVRVLAQTGPTRIAALPELTTLQEAGLNVDVVTRFGFFAPKGTPQPILDRLTRALLGAAADPAYQESMSRGFNPVDLLEPDRFRSFLEAEDRLTAQMITELGLKP